ncbi:MAG: TonB-dependent receptor [Tannerella sp.]|jgi:TonB-linked SusC/RagA family outer membrane protein|nr:TonB-dependent receptor [Tannerella sp.]
MTRNLINGMKRAGFEKLKRMMTLSVFLLMVGTGMVFARDGFPPETDEPEQSKIRITGTVVDAAGEPVVGANIVEKATRSNGTVTDVEGRFSLNVSPGATLVISFIGYVSKEIAVGNQTRLDIELLEDSEVLEEVVVVGYGTQKKVNLSGAVSTVSSKTLDNRPVTNANMALQGLAPGLNIQMSSGQATSAPDINIRGYTSINGGSAFILVDNVPVSADELSRINPADIESATVLKDAAASAIYGARAAFGVLLITTKTAKSDKLEVDVDVNYGIHNLFNLPNLITDISQFMDMTTAAGYPLRTIYSDTQREYARQRSANPSLSDVIPNPTNPNLWDYYAMTNWYETVYKQNTPSYTANVRIAQKRDRLTYAMSGGYYRQEGVHKLANDVFNRYTFRGNGTYDLTNWWKVGSHISFVHTGYDYPTTLDYNLFGKVQTEDVCYPLRNPDGTWTDGGADVVGLMTEGGRTDKQVDETQISLNTTIDILKDVWSIKGDVNFRRSHKDTDSHSYPSYYRRGPEEALMSRWNTGNNTFAAVTSNINNYTVFNVYTDFHKTFAGKHYVQALAGFNQEYLYISDHSVQRQQLISSGLPTLQLATGTVNAYQNIEELALRGIFYRLNYIYDNRYILEFDGRNDGTSRFPANKRWGMFPSGSVAWVLSQEKFFSGVNDALKISNLKLRGSYGVLGNQVVKSGDREIYYPYLAAMGSGTIGTVIDGTQPMAVFQPGTVAGDLTWERVRTINGGLDLGLFKNKLDLSFDLYTRYTEDMLTKSKSLPAFYGAGEPRSNAADLKTKGWELMASYRDQVNVAGSPLSFSLSFMLSDSRTWITRYDNPNKVLSDYYEGQELGSIWGLVTEGYFQSEEELANWPDQTKVGSDDNQYKFYVGDLKFKDLNEDNEISFGSGTVDDPGDRKIIGNDRARLPYSITVDGTWKGFDLRLFFQGVGKRDWYPDNRDFWGTTQSPWHTPLVKNLDAWTTENRNAYFPRVKQYIAEETGSNGTELGAPQTKYLQDASYLRLKNLTAGYTLPATISNRWKISHLRVYLSAENLWTLNRIDIKELDPEMMTGASRSSQYPFQRVFSLGLQLNF